MFLSKRHSGFRVVLFYGQSQHLGEGLLPCEPGFSTCVPHWDSVTWYAVAYISFCFFSDADPIPESTAERDRSSPVSGEFVCFGPETRAHIRGQTLETGTKAWLKKQYRPVSCSAGIQTGRICGFRMSATRPLTVAYAEEYVPTAESFLLLRNKGRVSPGRRSTSYILRSSMFPAAPEPQIRERETRARHENSLLSCRTIQYAPGVNRTAHHRGSPCFWIHGQELLFSFGGDARPGPAMVVH